MGALQPWSGRRRGRHLEVLGEQGLLWSTDFLRVGLGLRVQGERVHESARGHLADSGFVLKAISLDMLIALLEFLLAGAGLGSLSLGT